MASRRQNVLPVTFSSNWAPFRTRDTFRPWRRISSAASLLPLNCDVLQSLMFLIPSWAGMQWVLVLIGVSLPRSLSQF